MSSLTYETVARFAQQAGMIYFGLIFLAGCVYARWPNNRKGFDQAASLPLQEDEN